MKAPLIPIPIAFSIEFVLIVATKENINTPAIKDAKLLWSLRTGIESITELIFGTTNGANNDADNTAIIASLVKMVLIPETPPTKGIVICDIKFIINLY